MICRKISTIIDLGNQMKWQHCLTIVFLLVSFALHSALPEGLQKGTNPQLYYRLKPLADENLAKLSKAHAKSYRRLLAEHDDILMAYLIAYEQDAKLAEADAEITLKNYREIVRLLDREGLSQSPEFFLSYVARQSVSDERLSAYRTAMLEDGLAEIALIKEPLRRYRETANWCVEKLKFMQTSGRDLNPVDITRSTLTGRCEEMQILFVAAARTVGLPSRPASTPWWAHMDNNHAWAEVFLDGQWHYTGDMDAAYYPNQTWFSGMIDKTVMILAEGSLAAEDDEVLIRGRYETVINSTPNYAGDRSRKVEVICLDESGAPIPNAQVRVMVLNWGILRTLVPLESDIAGRLGFSAGSGDFYLLAYKDEKQALALVKASAAKSNVIELHLKRDALAGFDEILQYPANEMEWLEAPESYREQVQFHKEIWQKTIDGWEQAARASVVPDSLAILSRGNLSELESFWRQNQPVDEDYITFLQKYDPKFLWQADSALLEAHYRFWQEQDHEMPAELFFPTVYYEELPRPFIEKGQARLYPKSFIHKGKNHREIISRALKWQKKKYRIDVQKALSGLPRMDILAAQKYLNDIQYRLLAIYILRANGIPAEFTRLPDNILVYLDHDWHYLNIKEDSFTGDSKGHARKTGLYIKLRDEFGLPINGARGQFAPSSFVRGAFYSLNPELKELGGGEYRLDLPSEDIYLFFGYRISDSKTALQMIALSADADTLELVAHHYPRSWQDADPELLVIFSELVSEPDNLVILGNHDQENSLRVAQKLIDQNLPFVFLGHTQQGSRGIPGYVFSPTWQSFVRDDPALGQIPITFYKDADGWKMYVGIWERLP